LFTVPAYQEELLEERWQEIHRREAGNRRVGDLGQQSIGVDIQVFVSMSSLLAQRENGDTRAGWQISAASIVNYFVSNHQLLAPWWFSLTIRNNII
jgi:hypothetical protein